MVPGGSFGCFHYIVLQRVCPFLFFSCFFLFLVIGWMAGWDIRMALALALEYLYYRLLSCTLCAHVY